MSLVSRLRAITPHQQAQFPTCRRGCTNPASSGAVELGLCIEHLAQYMAEHGKQLAEREDERAKYAGYYKAKVGTTKPEEDVQ